VILLYCLSYADQWYANLFGFLEKRQPPTGSIARNHSIAVGLFFLINGLCTSS
jgi:hypothetical protein